jgi:hypothetical protein
MTGCVFKRKLPSGTISWGYIIDIGRNENGKRKQISKTGFARKLDADIALAKVLNERNEGTLVRPDPRTLAEFAEAGSLNTPKPVARQKQPSDTARCWRM